MALQNTDLLAVQQGVKVYSITAEKLREFSQDSFDPAKLPIATTTTPGAVIVGDNLTIDGSGNLDVVLPKGTKFMGQLESSDNAPGGPEGGQFWIFLSGGTLNSTWGNIQGSTVETNSAVMWSEDTNEWAIIAATFEAGVEAITAGAPINVNSDNAAVPYLSIPEASSSEDGYMSKGDKAKLDSIQPGSDIGTVTRVTGSAPIQVANDTTTPAITIDYATDTASGAVRIATIGDVTSGTTNAVVHAGQLKVAKEDISDVATRVSALEADPGVVLSSGQGIAINNVQPGLFTVLATDATTTAVGSVTLATDVEVLAGTDNEKVVTPFTAAAVYLPKDISSLPELN